MTSYAPLPVTFVKGKGVWLEDKAGERYLDALSGIAVCSLGHAHPTITEAIADQAGKLIHTSNLYHIELQEKLAARLCKIASMDRAFFSNSGAEANEAAIKLARLYGHEKGIGKPVIVVMEGSFHGRTMATLTATGNPKVQDGFGPLLEGFKRIPYNDIKALETLAERTSDIVAVLCEPIQGEGGVNVPAEDFLTRIRSICDQRGWLMILDEIQTGMGRTGKWFAYLHENVVPDVITLAKALGNGVPIGACIAKGRAAELFAPGNHGSTFGGNPLACRVALTVIETLEANNLISRAEAMGNYLRKQLEVALKNLEGVSDIRGKGMMIGIELERECGDLAQSSLEKRLLINVTAGNTIRLLPPLVVSKEECDLIVKTLSDLIKSFLQK